MNNIIAFALILSLLSSCSRLRRDKKNATSFMHFDLVEEAINSNNRNDLKIVSIHHLNNQYFIENTSILDSIQMIRNSLSKTIKLIEDYGKENGGIVNEDVNSDIIYSKYKNLKLCLDTNNINYILASAVNGATIYPWLDPNKHAYYIKASIRLDSLSRERRNNTGRFLCRNYSICNASEYFELPLEKMNIIVKYIFQNNESEIETKHSLFKPVIYNNKLHKYQYLKDIIPGN